MPFVNTNLTPSPVFFFIAGARRGVNPDTYWIVQISKTPSGWSQRVVSGCEPTLNVDYVSDENREDISSWAMCDFKRGFRMFESLAEAQEHQSIGESHRGAVA